MSVAPQSSLASVAWFDLCDPASPELDAVAHRFGFHPLQVEDCRHRPQRAKIEEHDPFLFVVLKRIQSNGELDFDDVDVFVAADHIVSVHQGDAAFVQKVRTRAEQEHVSRPDRMLYIMVDTIVDEYAPVLDQIADEIADLETEILERPDPDMLARIFRLKRKLIEFRRVAGSMREVANAIVRRQGGIISDELDPYFRDIYDHLVRTTEFVETYRDLLTGALDIYLSAVANRTNEVMKVLTIYGTIALPLIIITGFFGMNFEHLPWIHALHGFAYAGGLMVLSTLLVLIYFRLKHWF